MTRALSVTCLSLAVALLSATAEAKPTVAVLGLEVSTPDNGQMDQQTTAAANNLTVALRDRVRSGSGPYDTAPGSDKELIDLKLLNECSSEAMPCMVKIGNDLGAKFMLYGHVAKASGTYRVSVTLLNVDNKSKGMSKSFDVPVADLTGGPKSKDTLVWARKIYGELTGETSQGTVIVRVTGADHGTLLVLENGTWQPKGSITSGQGRTTLPEGKYKIAVESEGFQRFESTVTVTSGQDSSIPVRLEAMPGVGGGSDALPGTGSGDGHVYGGTVSDPGEHSRTGLKVGAWGTLAVGAVAGGIWAYEYFGVQADYNSDKGTIVNPTTFAALPPPGSAKKWDNSVCGQEPDADVDPTKGTNNKFKKACSAYSAEKILVPATVGFALISAGLFYFAYRGDGEHAPTGTTVSRKHKQKPTMALIPTMTPQGAGATFRLDW